MKVSSAQSKLYSHHDFQFCEKGLQELSSLAETLLEAKCHAFELFWVIFGVSTIVQLDNSVSYTTLHECQRSDELKIVETHRIFKQESLLSDAQIMNCAKACGLYNNTGKLLFMKTALGVFEKSNVLRLVRKPGGSKLLSSKSVHSDVVQ